MSPCPVCNQHPRSAPGAKCRDCEKFYNAAYRKKRPLPRNYVRVARLKRLADFYRPAEPDLFGSFEG